MPLEQEVMSLLVGGFSIVMLVAVLVTLFFWVKNKNSGYLWIMLNLLSFSTAIYFALKAISSDYNHPMSSENMSLQIGIAGVIWFISMVFLVIALFSFSKSGRG